MRLIFATHNKNKVLEVKSLISGVTELLSLGDVSLSEDIAETADTLEGNALLKARYVYRKTAISCFADDSGLEVDALDGRPGVYSARYAGAQKSDADNMQKLLHELAGKSNRGAQFRTVIALILDGKEYVFEGLVRGTITGEQRGSQGFGYDPLFVPEGYQSTFAELGPEVKNRISHRAIAVTKLVDFLQLQLTENKDTQPR